MDRCHLPIAAVLLLAVVGSATADDTITPILKTYCLKCHGPEEQKGGVRLDQFAAPYLDDQFKLLEEMLDVVSFEDMPPDDELQPSAEERQAIVAWIKASLATSREHIRRHDGTVRRLTVAQYRNTLRDLLGLEDDFADVLPPDSISRDGFSNNGNAMALSPLLLETYFQIAEEALDRSIVNVGPPPVIQTFRVDVGKGVNPEPYVGNLILGAGSELLANKDVLVTELAPHKPFEYEPFAMRTSYRFIEGYQGNGTVRGWRDFDSIYHAVFADMRGQGGYPKGAAYKTVPGALLLRPAIPSKEIFGQSTTYGPSANFKIAVRELAEHGRFRITVRASKVADALLHDKNTAPREETSEASIAISDPDTATTVIIEHAGIYQADVYLPQKEAMEKRKPEKLALTLGDRTFTSTLKKPAFLTVRLPAGELAIEAALAGGVKPERLVLTRLDASAPAALSFASFERRNPKMTAHLGLRRDCGSTLPMVAEPMEVSLAQPTAFVFEGALRDFPRPHVEKNNVNYLAGVKEIGVRHAYTDGRDMPRLAIHSVEFQGPLLDSWPPATHSSIFIDSSSKGDPYAYALEIIRSFAARAFRRPITTREEELLYGVWARSFGETRSFQKSIKDALLVVLTSPQFLYIVEESTGPEAEALDPFELASKLAYFLWNSAPDERLIGLASAGTVHSLLDSEIDRLVRDPRFEDFLAEFTGQWLGLAAFDTVGINPKLFPKLTRDTKVELRKEPAAFMAYVFEHDLPLSTIIASDFILVNEVVASYYGLADKSESGFEFLPIKHETNHLGGLLSQASVLAGLSDGNEPNPVKRGAWFARKLIAEPPDPPPPNVPDLKEDTAHLPLRERLLAHRDQVGCIKCHKGIDPWGIPFEVYDAGGIFREGVDVDSLSTLPDGTEVQDLTGLKTYLLDVRLDQLAFSFMKHLATYASGRTLSRTELEYLKNEGRQLAENDYSVQDMLRFVINSPIFQTK